MQLYNSYVFLGLTFGVSYHEVQTRKYKKDLLFLKFLCSHATFWKKCNKIFVLIAHFCGKKIKAA